MDLNWYSSIDVGLNDHIDSVEFMTHMDESWEIVVPISLSNIYKKEKSVGTIYDKLCSRQYKSDILYMK